MIPNNFYPSLCYITNITNALNAVVTFLVNHDFTDGEIISLRSSRPYGMYEVNNLRARVLSHTSNTVNLELSTLNFNAFVYPPVGQVIYPAMAVPSSSGVVPNSLNPTIPAYITGTNLEDSFDNIPSPYEVYP